MPRMGLQVKRLLLHGCPQAQVMSEEAALARMGSTKHGKAAQPVMFYGTLEFAWVPARRHGLLGGGLQEALLQEGLDAQALCRRRATGMRPLPPARTFIFLKPFCILQQVIHGPRNLPWPKKPPRRWPLCSQRAQHAEMVLRRRTTS